MSRGLGELQREVLAALPKSKAECLDYRGGGSYPDWDPLPFSLPGWVYYRRSCVRLADDVYDMLAVGHLLKQSRRFRLSDSTAAFLAAYSRAVRTLLARGIIKPLTTVPIQAVDEDPNGLVHELADGQYLMVSRDCKRFVRQAELMTPAAKGKRGRPRK